MKTKNEKSIEQIALDKYFSTLTETRENKITSYLPIVSLCLSLFMSLLSCLLTTNTVFEVIFFFFLLTIIYGIIIILILNFFIWLYFILLRKIMERKFFALLSTEERHTIISDYINELIIKSETSIVVANRKIKELKQSISCSEEIIKELKDKLQTI